MKHTAMAAARLAAASLAAASLAAAVLLAACLAVPCLAAEPEPGAGFYVEAVIPGNQRDPEATYFDLLMEPGQEQVLLVDIVNPSEEEITVSVETVTASTNRNGIINYSTPGLYDASMECAFAEIAKPEEESLVVAPYSSEQARIQVEMPQEPFSGMLLGSIRVTKELSEEEVEAEMGIVNQFGYAIGVRLTEKEEEIEPDFSLGEVGGENINYRAAIVAQICNTTPVIARDITVTSQIFPKGEQIPLIEKRQESVDMAPNAVFPMSMIDEAGYGFPEGEYTAVVGLEYDGQVWDFEREFTIEPQTANDINGAALNQQSQRGAGGGAMSQWTVLAIVLGCAAAGAVVAIKVLSRKRSIR